jgi:hypothetical protein
MQTILAIGEAGVAVEPLIAMVSALGIEEAASRSSGVPTQAGMMGAGGYRFRVS